MAEAIETSKTRRVYLTLRDRISSGELTPGTRLPSEPDLAELHDVSRVTIRRALAELEREGLISRRPGAGTFITARMIKRPIVADLSNALAHLVEMGRSTDVRRPFEPGRRPAPRAQYTLLARVQCCCLQLRTRACPSWLSPHSRRASRSL